MSGPDQTAEWIAAVIRDYGPEAWSDESSVRRDAEFVVLDPEGLARRCGLLRGLRVSASAEAKVRSVDEVKLLGMVAASSDAVRSVMSDPEALCEVHCNAWTSDGPWSIARDRYFASRSALTKAATSVAISRPARYRSAPVLSPAAASPADDRHEVEHEIVLGDAGDTAPVASGSIRLWRVSGDAPPDSWWLTIRLTTAICAPDCAGTIREATGSRRPRIIGVECPKAHGVLGLDVLLVADGRGGLATDRYLLRDINPYSEGFAFTLTPEPFE